MSRSRSGSTCATPTATTSAVLSEEFGLHPLAVEDALHHSQRPKLDRYPSHLFLTAYAVRLDAGTGELVTSELAAFITRQALVTVRKDDGLDIDAVVERWDDSPDLARYGVGYLLYGLLDYIVDSHFDAVQCLDDAIEELEDLLFDDARGRHGGAAAQLRAAQEPGAAAPRRAADARGRQRADAPRPAPRRRGD